MIEHLKVIQSYIFVIVAILFGIILVVMEKYRELREKERT